MAKNIFNYITPEATELILKISDTDVFGINRSDKIDVKIGVYFLFKNNELVYIGKSTDIIGRLKHHLRTKDFDEYSFIELESDLLDAYERILINIYKPILNKDAVTLKLKK